MLPAAALAAIVLYGGGLAWVAVGQAHLERSFRLADQGQVAEAIAEVEKAGAIDPQLDLYKFQRAYYLGRLASTEPDSLAPAIQAFSDALASEDTFSLHWVNLAALQAAAQNWAAALGAAQRATELNPPDPQCWLNLGWIAEQMGKSDMALDAYARALAAAPAWAGSDFWKASDWRSEWRPVITGRAAVWGGHSGLIHLAIGAPDSARLLCSRPQTAPDYVCLGRSLMATGEPNAALSVFDEGLRIHPSSAALFAERAWVKKALDMSVEAGRDARIALFISPLSGSRAHMVLAQAALEGDDPDSAIDHLWRAIPPTYVSQNWEVALYNRRADFRPLPQMVRVAGGKEEMEPGLWLADLLLSQGRAEEAELVYLLLLQRDPYWREVQERLEALGRV
jgi:tetratricopeptide (TPR) repeat protein